jgi:predicted ArsR family transcriptional regulator
VDANPDHDRRIAALAALDQPLRRDLYRMLADAAGWTTRDDAAAALHIPRSVAAFHLDKLVDAGVVEVRFERLGGRSGPGAGRPAKLYRPAGDEVSASVPDRHYDLAGSLLAGAIAESAATGAPVRECLRTAAHSTGRAIGRDASADGDVGTRADPRAEVVSVLQPQGYEPVDGDDAIALANCPFHRLAEEQRDLVCGMNLDFLRGVLEGLGVDDELTARLDPAPGYCCVRIAAGRV